MAWNRRRDALLNGGLAAAIGFAIARVRGREDAVRVAVLAGIVFAAINWLGYERPAIVEVE